MIVDLGVKYVGSALDAADDAGSAARGDVESSAFGYRLAISSKDR